MVEELNSDAINTITYNATNGSFMYCFITFGSCIRGYYHILKVIVIDSTHLYGKYKSVLLSVVVYDTEKHIY